MATAALPLAEFASLHGNGNVVFIVNEEGRRDEGFVKREGARKDLDNLQAVFVQALGFKWINAERRYHYNLTLDNWDHSIYNTDENMRNVSKCTCVLCLIKESCQSESKYFVLAISTDGGQSNDAVDFIKFSDGKSLSTNEILKALDDENCPVLKGKIRIVLVGACRGNRSNPESLEDKGITYVTDLKSTEENCADQDQCAGTDSDLQEDQLNDNKLIVTDTLNVPPDYLVVYSTTTGKISKRNIDDGVWMFHYFDQVVRQNGLTEQGIDFLKILTKANRLMSERETRVVKRNENSEKMIDKDGKYILDEEKSGLKSCMCIYHNLTDILMLYPKTPEPTPIDVPSLFGGLKKKKKAK